MPTFYTKQKVVNKCQRCSTEFNAIRKDAKYCSDDCRFLRKHCLNCGIEFKTKSTEKSYCTIRCYNSKSKKSHYDFAKQLLEAHNGNIVPLEVYKGSDTKMRCMCVKCGNEIVRASRLYIGSYCYGCNHCGNKSQGELLIESWLRENKCSYERQYTFEDLVYSNKLYYDFAVFEGDRLKLLIEYDGVQHFKPVHIFGGEESYHDTVIRDEIKTNYANEIGVELLRISYKDKKKINKMLSEVLAKAPIPS